MSRIVCEGFELHPEDSSVFDYISHVNFLRRFEWSAREHLHAAGGMVTTLVFRQELIVGRASCRLEFSRSIGSEPLHHEVELTDGEQEETVIVENGHAALPRARCRTRIFHLGIALARSLLRIDFGRFRLHLGAAFLVSVTHWSCPPLPHLSIQIYF